MSSQAQDHVSIENDREEDTAVDHFTNPYISPGDLGAAPSVIFVEEKTTERCVICGRGPGTEVDRFDLGIKHIFGRLATLLQKRGGVPKEEADAIVASLRAADVEAL